MADPFRESRTRYRHARAEFARFVQAKLPTLLDEFKAVDRGDLLFNRYTFFVDAPKDVGERAYANRFSSVMFIQAGSEFTGRYDVNGKRLREGHLSLLYSFGFTGEIAAILYPFKADEDNWKPHEDNLLLRIVPGDQSKLQKAIKKDLKAMVAYGHVTAIDGQPTLVEKLHVWWLRFFCGKNVDKKWQDAKRIQVIYKSLAAVSSGSLSGVFRLVMPIAVAYLLLRFGIHIQGW